MNEKEKHEMEKSVASYVGSNSTGNEAKIVEKNSGNPFEMQVEKTNEQQTPEKAGIWQTVKKVLSYIFIDGLSGMAIG